MATEPATRRAALTWRCRDRAFDVSQRALVMGVVNVTPDSFSDGGLFMDPAEAITHARRLIAEGADLVDLGAESTRPGSEPVPAAEQLRRLMPVVEALADNGACLSVDTASAAVARRVLEAGACVINDVTASADPEMAGVVAEAGAGVVLMHMRGTPATMQEEPRYGDVTAEVREFLAGRVRAAEAAGIGEDRIAVDPGIGFGKTLEHNLELIARLGEIATLGRPVLVGASRKSFLGRLLDADVDERLGGGLAAAAIAVFLGAHVIRTHDVAATVSAVRVASAIAGTRRV